MEFHVNVPEKCSREKNSKVRLTGMAAASATGEKLPMFVVRKSKKATMP